MRQSTNKAGIKAATPNLLLYDLAKHEH